MFRAVDGLQRAVRDEPTANTLALVRILDDGADDVHGWLANALEAAQNADAAAAPPLVDLESAQAALVEAKGAYFVAAERLGTLLAPERLAEIEGAGRERGGDWREWAIGVHDALEQCRAQDRAIVPALFACFEEVSEHATTAVARALQWAQRDLPPIPQMTTSDPGGERP
jgi:hypothetical protein